MERNTDVKEYSRSAVFAELLNVILQKSEKVEETQNFSADSFLGLMNLMREAVVKSDSPRSSVIQNKSPEQNGQKDDRERIYFNPSSGVKETAIPTESTLDPERRVPKTNNFPTRNKRKVQATFAKPAPSPSLTAIQESKLVQTFNLFDISADEAAKFTQALKLRSQPVEHPEAEHIFGLLSLVCPDIHVDTARVLSTTLAHCL